MRRLFRCLRPSAKSHEGDVSKAHHIALAQARGGDDSLRYNFLNDGGLASVVKLFVGGVKSLAHDASDVIAEI